MEIPWATLLSGSFGLLTAAVVLLIAQRYDREKRKAEEGRWRHEREAEEQRWRDERALRERQWYLDRLLARKFDTLAALHAALIDCHSALNRYLSFPPATVAEFNEQLQKPLDLYLRSLVLANVYLTAEQKKVLDRRLGSFRVAVQAIVLGMPDDAFHPPRPSSQRAKPAIDPWKDFFETQEAAEVCLRELLDPGLAQLLQRPADTGTDT